MAQVCARRDAITAEGAELLFVGSGTPAMAAAFQAERCPDAEVAVDPGRTVYDAFQLRRSLGSTFGFRAVGSALRAFGSGHRQGRMQGDAFQQGGAFLIDSAGKVRYAYVSEHAGDHPEAEDLIEAAAQLKREASAA